MQRRENMYINRQRQMCKADKETWWHYTKCQETGFRNKISHKVSIRKYKEEKLYKKKLVVF